MKTPDSTLTAESSALDRLNFTPKSKLTPRQSRLLNAFLTKNDWIFREDVDRIAGASNGPQIISELRRKVTGHDGLDMRQIDAIDRDGKACRPGQYRINDIGLSRLYLLGLGNHGERSQ